MSLREQLVALLSRYDDDAWVAIANRGLLRRAQKDLATLDVRLASETADMVAITVGERRVRLGAAGPTDATCDCPSPVMCQHVLTAGLWLSTQRQAGQAPAPVTVDELHGQLMAIDEAMLTSYAGVAGVRWAHQYLRDLDTRPHLQRNGYLAITLPQPEVVVRYLGGGLDGLVVDHKVPSLPRYRVAAVMAWQQAHGVIIEPPAVRSRPSGPTEAGLSLEDSRARLRAAVRALLTDVVRIGVSHLSPGVLERFTTAAVWAQGVEYHRLARLLRRLADQIDLQLARSAAANDLQLLDETALAYALTEALEAAAANGGAPPWLLGRARGSYDELRSLELVGLGGYAWRSGTGYHGLSCVFWAPGRERYYTWTDTRPENLQGFDPLQRWFQPAPWSGLSSPAAAAGRLLTLTAAQVSPDARISGVESTMARTVPVGGTQLAQQLLIHQSWADIRETVGRQRSLLAPPDPNAAWAVLQPAIIASSVYDRAEQALRWPLTDIAGESLLLELPWSQQNAHAIGRIETLGDLAEGTLIVARLQARQGQLVGFPLSLIHPDRAAESVDSLHFHPGTRGSELVAALQRSGTADRGENAPSEHSPVPLPLAGLRAMIEQFGQRGSEGHRPAALHSALMGAHRALRDIGWLVFRDPEPAVAPAELLLRSHTLVQQAELLLSGRVTG
jgi:hypothetical protein